MTSRIEGERGAVLAEERDRRGDAVLVASTSGRNAVAIATSPSGAARLGPQVIGITSLDYTNAVTSRHPQGLKLKDVVDLVVTTRPRAMPLSTWMASSKP